MSSKFPRRIACSSIRRLLLARSWSYMNCRTELVLSKDLSCVRVWIVAVPYVFTWTRKSFNSSRCFKVSSSLKSLEIKYRLWFMIDERTILHFFQSEFDSDLFFIVACEFSSSSFKNSWPWQAFLIKVPGSSHLSWTLGCTPRKWNWNKSSVILDKNSHQNPAGLSSTTSFSSYSINSLPLSHELFPHTFPPVQSCCFHKILR